MLVLLLFRRDVSTVLVVLVPEPRSLKTRMEMHRKHKVWSLESQILLTEVPSEAEELVCVVKPSVLDLQLNPFFTIVYIIIEISMACSHDRRGLHHH